MSKRVRKTQEERRADTNEKLLSATIQTIIELGYSRLTTTQICKTAGVSQGALFKYYPTKAALIARAAETLYEQLVSDYVHAFAHVPQADDQLRAGIEALWELYDTPRLHAIYDLQIAARTDDELRASLAPMEAAHRENVRAVGQQLFPSEADADVFVGILGVVVYAIHGLALSKLVVADPEMDRVRIDTLVKIARTFLTQAPPNS